METLPGEIFHSIFIQLPFKQRLKCTLVCRYWYNSLNNHSLLYNVEILGDKMHNNFMNMLQQIPSRAPQVEILKLHISSAFDKRILCNIFPNLREFQYSRTYTISQSKTKYSTPLKLTRPNSKLEIIKEEDECELSRQLLAFGLCARLRNLKLDIGDIDNHRKEIFIHLDSAPALKELHLNHCKVGIDDIELIHSNVLALETLDLDNICFIPNKLPLDILPATSVTLLQITMCEVIDDVFHLDWYKYLAKKYTNLTYFNYNDDKILDYTYLKTMNIYRNGVIPIFKNFGIPLPYYHFIDLQAEINPFITLDSFGVGVAQFSFMCNQNRPLFERLVESNQSKYVESLKLNDTAIGSPRMLQHLTSLREIDIYAIKSRVDLIDYLNAFPPTLTMFSAYFYDTEINELPSHSNNVQNFFLRCDVLHPNLGKAISDYFPRLNNLFLEGRVSENLTVDLSTHHLENLEIDATNNANQPHGFSVTKTNVNQRQYYIRDRISGALKSATAEELQGRAIISISYSTAVTIYCDNSKIDS